MRRWRRRAPRHRRPSLKPRFGAAFFARKNTINANRCSILQGRLGVNTCPSVFARRYRSVSRHPHRPALHSSELLELAPEGAGVELFLDGLREAFANAVGLGTASLVKHSGKCTDQSWRFPQTLSSRFCECSDCLRRRPSCRYLDKYRWRRSGGEASAPLSLAIRDLLSRHKAAIVTLRPGKKAGHVPASYISANSPLPPCRSPWRRINANFIRRH